MYWSLREHRINETMGVLVPPDGRGAPPGFMQMMK
jgi:hypothetical protein